MSADSPRVLVSVLAYNGLADTLETLAGFSRQDYPNLTLQVIDNASPEILEPGINAAFPNIPVIRLEHNGGYTGGNNHALDQALAQGYDFVVISNHDVNVPPDLITHLVETARSQKDCGLVGIVEENYQTGEIRAAGGRDFRFWRSRGVWIQEMPPSGVRAVEADYVQGSVMLFTRQALEKGLRLDEKLFMYCEEFDLSFQLRSSGLKAYVDTRARIRHKSLPHPFSLFQGYLIQRNRLYICRKYAGGGSLILAVFYLLFFELPAKTIFRVLQGQARYARVCWRAFWDALTGKTGKPDPAIFA